VGQIFIPNINVSLFQEEIAPVFTWHNVGKGLRHTRQPLILLGFCIYSYYTLRGGFDIMSLFRDVINEWFVADTSRKIKAVFKSRMEQGLRCSGSVPYGFLPDGEDKSKLLIDEPAAVVVRRIYQSIIDGKSMSDIAKALRAEQIPIPSEHWKRIGAPVRSVHYADPYA